MQTLDRNSFRVKLVFSRTLNSQSAASVTMGSLAAYLRSSGFQTDLCLLDKKELHNDDTILGNSFHRNIVIAKPNFKDFQTMIPLLKNLKRHGLAKRVFFCGPFAKLNAQSLMSEMEWLDGIIIDQIEASAKCLLSTMSQDLESWNVASPGSLSRNPITLVVEKHVRLMNPIPLSDLPFPARDIETGEDVLYVNIEASRGCLFDCSFCHIPLMSEISVKGLPINIRDPVLVVDEIEWLNKELGKTLFIFNDSCFWSTKKDDLRILRFCDEITKRKLDVRLYVYLKGEPFVGDDVLHALVKAGLVRVFLGVENSVKSSLAIYRKKIRPDLYSTLRDKLARLGVNIHVGYITLEPYSSLDDVLSNIEYLFYVGKLFRLGVILEPVRVIPGTSLHSRLVKEGLMDSNLGFDEITYGYMFAHKGVGVLLRQWKAMFEGTLRDAAYGFEYYSTTGELLRVLAERLDNKFVSILHDHYEAFNTEKVRGMQLLLDYFRSTIADAKNGPGPSTGETQCREFAHRFSQMANNLAVLHAGMISVMRANGGERAVREVYMG